MDPGRIWRGEDGRLRLGWRLVAFVAVWFAVALLTTPLFPGGLPWAAVPGLLGALAGGWILLSLEGRRPAELGFIPGRVAVRGSLLGLALGAGVGLAAVALIALAGGLRWVPQAGTLPAWLAAGAAALWRLALPAAAEEAMLRGYPLGAMAEAWGAGAALGLTSVVFALLHVGNPAVGGVGLVTIAAAGLFLGALRLRTGSLWWPTGAHLGWNWAHAFLADLPVSGLDVVDAPLVAAATAGPAWLSGGAFGPEGSVAAAPALLAAAAWTWRTRRLGPEGPDGGALAPVEEGTA